MSSKEQQPILASELANALEFVTSVCPKTSDDPTRAFVVIVPEPDRHRFLVTASNGSMWVGAYVQGDGMHRVALTQNSAQRAARRLKFESKAQDAGSVIVQPANDSKRTWYVADNDNTPVVVRLTEFFPRWDVKSKTAPPLFPTGWEAPVVSIRDAFAASPVAYPSTVFQLGKKWPHLRAMWWVDALYDLCRIEFTRGEANEVVAFAVVVPHGKKVSRPDRASARQREFTQTATDTTPPPTAGPDAAQAIPAGDEAPSIQIVDENAADAGEASDTTKPTIPENVSPALLAALRLALAFRLATSRHEVATYTGKRLDEATTERKASEAAFWSAYESLSEEDRSLCTDIAGDAEQLDAVLDAHPDPAAKKRAKKKSDGDQQPLAGE